MAGPYSHAIVPSNNRDVAKSRLFTEKLFDSRRFTFNLSWSQVITVSKLLAFGVSVDSFGNYIGPNLWEIIENEALYNAQRTIFNCSLPAEDAAKR